MIQTLKGLLATRTARQTFTLFFGSVVSKGIAFAVLFWLARRWDRSVYDQFALCLTVMWFVFEFTELGARLSVVRHAAEQLEQGEHDRAAGMFRTVALAKLAMWLLVFLLGWATAPVLAPWLLGPDAPSRLLTLSLLAGIGLGVIVLLTGVFHAAKHFWKDVALSLVQNVAKLAAVVGLALGARLSLGAVVATYSAVPWLAVAAGIFLIPAGFRRWGRLEPGDLRSLFRFAGLMAVVVTVSASENRVGVFLLQALTPSRGEVADFFLAQQIGLVFLFLLASYQNVMLSKISSVRRWSEVVRVTRKSMGPLSLFAAVVVVVGATTPWWVPLFLPGKYVHTVPAARWLLLTLVLPVLGTPAFIVVMFLKKVWVLLVAHVMALGLLISLCFGLIPGYGAVGLAVAFGLSQGLCYLVMAVFAIVAIRADRSENSKPVARNS